MKMLLSVLFLASTLLSCSKKSSDDDGAKDPRTDVSGGAAAVTSTWQNDFQKSSNAFVPGTYVITEISNATVNSEYNASATFIHRMTVAKGSPKTGDFADGKADWGKLNKETHELRLTTELNLALELNISANQEISFNDKHYYWNQLNSSSSWSWRSTAEKSPNGTPYHKLFEKKKANADGFFAGDKIYSNELESKGSLVQESTDKLKVRFLARTTETIQYVTLTYERK